MANAYTDQELAGLNVLLLRNLDGDLNTFGGFQDQIDSYVKLVASLPDGDPFKDAINATATFYTNNKALVDKTHAAIGAMLTAFATPATAGVVWGGCNYAAQSQVLNIAGLASSPSGKLALKARRS